MKTPIFLAILFLFPCIANCQEGKKDFLMLQIGPAFPVGAFAQNDYDRDDPGFAVTGIHVELQYAHALSRKWGYLIAFKVNSFPLDETAFFHENALYVWDSLTISSENFNIYGLYSGIFYECVTRDKFALQIHGMIGVNTISYPRTIIQSKKELYYKTEEDADNTVNFSWTSRASAQFYISQKFNLSANFGFMHTRASYDRELSAIFGSSRFSGKDNVEQSINAIEFGIGLIYKLQ